MTTEISEEQYKALTQQIVQLYEYMERIKSEIATVKHPNSPVDHFNKVSDQLNAIVVATEDATHTIMEAVEGTAAIIDDLKDLIRVDEVTERFDKIIDHSNRVFEACTFQDITGQRISKIVRTMNLLEGTLNSLVVIIGKDSIAALPISDRNLTEGHDDVPMHGPVLSDEGVSQAEIDAMFD